MSGPFYVMAASVPPGNRIVQFHGSGSDSAAHMLANVERFRYAGFDVAIPDTPSTGPEDSLELRWGDRKVLQLFQDGTLVFGGRADNEFLAWAHPQEYAALPRLNPVAVAEVHASFVWLYREVHTRLREPAEQIVFSLKLTGGVWDGGRLVFTRYFSHKNWDPAAIDQYPLQVDPGESEIEASAEELHDRPRLVAGRMLEAFTSWFDYPVDAIPFTREAADGLREVDLDALLAL